MGYAAELLKKNGLRKTEQRLAVLEVMALKDEPITEAEILEAIPYDYDRITLYRTLQTLINSGVVHRITVDNIAVKYALTGPHTENHIHFYCTSCHKVTCLGDVPADLIKIPSDYEQLDCEVLVKGICGDCKTKQKN